jgi:hypothetical protein
LTAKLVNEAHQAEFVVSLLNYDGIVRLGVTENKEAQRFSVPDIVSTEIDTRQTPWERSSVVDASASVGAGRTDVFLQYRPFQLVVFENKKPIIVFNAQQLFEFEHLREKQACF